MGETVDGLLVVVDEVNTQFRGRMKGDGLVSQPGQLVRGLERLHGVRS